MEEFQEQNKPVTTSAAEHQDVMMYAWQMIVADFDCEIADGKETFGQKPTQQSVQEEYSIYVMRSLLSPTYSVQSPCGVRGQS